MATAQKDFIQKGIKSAEQATAEDKAQNYEAAAQHYMTAADWLMQALKCETMNQQMKLTIRPKIESYVKRAEEIKEILKRGPTEKKAVADTVGAYGNSKDNIGDDDDSGDPEKKQMMQNFENAIVTDSNVTFADVVGLDQAKEALKEAVVLPVKFPQLFQGARRPWSGILLYGPHGAGKSYLARALAAECKATFISVSSLDFRSRYCGYDDNRVRTLFRLAHDRQPCIVFIDDIDALCAQRNDTESESSRRVKTEFLVQMQGVGSNNSNVLVLAATNIPWALDTAIRRRLEKRIYIPLPSLNERAAMFKKYLSNDTFHEIEDQDWMHLAERSEHYSGADIAVVCREALLRPIRRLGSATHFKRVPNTKPDGPRELWLVCSSSDSDAEPRILDNIEPDEIYLPPVTMSDVIAALATHKATVEEADLIKFQQFIEEFS